MSGNAVSGVSGAGSSARASANPNDHGQQQIAGFQQLCRTLQEAVDRLNTLHEEIVSGHSEAIARLSMEIARKVLMRNIHDADYEIEAVIKEALQNAPENTELKIRLNPADLETLRQLQTTGDAAFENAEFTPDPAVGRAECVIESPKGIINVLIDDHLERIGNALLKTGGQ